MRPGGYVAVRRGYLPPRLDAARLLPEVVSEKAVRVSGLLFGVVAVGCDNLAFEVVVAEGLVEAATAGVEDAVALTTRRVTGVSGAAVPVETGRAKETLRGAFRCVASAAVREKAAAGVVSERSMTHGIPVTKVPAAILR
jgi:hypothetical protein